MLSFCQVNNTICTIARLHTTAHDCTRLHTTAHDCTPAGRGAVLLGAGAGMAVPALVAAPSAASPGREHCYSGPRARAGRT